jgi:hypothetical protein
VRVLIAAASALAALVLVSASQAAFPASQGRLLIVSENHGFATPELLRTGQPLVTGVPVGIHGTAAMSPDGTQMALVDTVQLFPEEQVPALTVGTLLGESPSFRSPASQDALRGRLTGRRSRSPATRAAAGTSTSSTPGAARPPT